MPHLSYYDATGRQAKVPLSDKEIVIGRQNGCDVIISKRVVSRRHARLFLKAGRWALADLGSSHGTFVNRLRVTEQLLSPGDVITIGEDSLTFEAGDAPATARPGSAVPSVAVLEPGMATASNPRAIPAAAGGTEMILAEHKVDSGELMRTMISARKGEDAASISRRSSDVSSHLLQLVRMSEELRRCTSVEQVTTTAVTMALKATGATRGVLALRDESSGEIVPKAQLDARRASSPTDEEVRISRTFVDKVVKERVALLAKDTDADVALSAAASVVAIGIRSMLCAPLWDEQEILGYLYLDITGAARNFRPADLDLISAIGNLAASEIGRLRLMGKIRDEEARRKNLARFLSGEVIRHIEGETREGKLDLTLSTREQEVTILFCDVVGFTRIAERMSPADVKRFLDQYLGTMTEILVDRHGGTLDKYVGDAIMALFGAPFSAEGPSVDAARAVAAAVEMQEAVKRLKQERLDFADLAVRIGINTGRVVAGMIGSERRLEYTVIGDPVNVAARMESTAEPGRIQIGPSTHARVKDLFRCEFAGERRLKNREQAVECWWVLGPLEAAAAAASSPRR